MITESYHPRQAVTVLATALRSQRRAVIVTLPGTTLRESIGGVL